jgi:alpha-2-macroglobulin
MRVNRVMKALFVLMVVIAPMLSACGQKFPAPAPEPVTATVVDVTQAPAPATGEGVPGAVTPANTSAPTRTPLPTPTRQPLPPAIVGVQPERGEEQPIGDPVILTFDQPMDPTTTTSAFSIQPQVRGEVKVRGNQLIFSPAERLTRATDYRIEVSDKAASSAGLKLQAPLSYRFKTTGYPQVTDTQPGNRASDVPIDNPIVVAFNRPIIALESPSAPAQGPDPLVITPTVIGTGEWINTAIYRFRPSEGLAASTTYTVAVKAGLEDTTGSALAEDYVFFFRTVDPTILNWLPENNLSLGVDSPITVTFSLPMDRPSTEAAFGLSEENGERVPGFLTWSEGDTVLAFKAARALKFGSTYQAVVAATARPANGQGALRESSQRIRNLRTVPLPKVVRTDPRDQSKRSDPTGGMRFEFASPMDPTSFMSGTLTVIPKPTRMYTSYNEIDNYLYLSFAMLPSISYRVTLSGRVADPYGNTLGRDVVVQFTTRDYDPILQLNSPGLVGTYNAYTQTKAAVTYRNVGEMDFRLYRVSPEDFLELTTGDYWQAWNRYKPATADLVREWNLKTDAKRNTVAVVHQELVDQEGEAVPSGMYFLELSSPGLGNSDGSANRQLFARTSLNVTLKSAPQEALAWVTDLKSGEPVEGATVRFTDNKNSDLTVTSDRNGIAKVTLPSTRRSWDPLVAFVTTGSGGFGVASSNWQDGINPWDFGIPGGVSAEPSVGYVYTDRPIYRPGQTVYWKALIRKDDDARYSLLAPGQPVTVTVNDDQGNKVLEQSMTLDPAGAVHGKVVLSLDASLGNYFITVRLDEQNSSGTGFQVAEYRKPEYELSAETDKPEYTQGEQTNVTLDASYFFGGAVKDAKVSWSLLTNDHYFEYQGKGFYSFSDWDWYEPAGGSSGGLISQGSGKTDGQGRFTFSVPADISKYVQSQRFTFDITVTDLNNQAVSTQASAVVHKGAFYIGLRPEGYVTLVGDPSRVEVITVDPKSQPVPRTDVTLVVNRMEWYSVQQKAEDGRFYWETKVRKTPVYTDTLTTDAKGSATLTWTPKSGGEYKVEATARDVDGHTLRSSAYVWVSGREYVSWRQENNDRIELVADRDEYKPGETAELLVASPYQGPVKALITVERNHILSDQVIVLNGNSHLLRIPILPDHAPNIYVSVVLVKGMDETSPAPSFKMGLRQLKVSVADKQLQVIVKPDQERVAPREKVGWTVRTLDAAGKPVPAEVSLALVDKAIYSLAGDAGSTLMDRFYSQRSPGVQTATTLVVNVDRVVAQLPEGGKGGGGGGGGPMGGDLSVRRAFPDVAYWNAAVTTGANGMARVEMTLPDNLTTWTMDARAITADTLVGQSKTDVMATKDLLVRPILPRFFIEGDRAEIGAVIHNNTRLPRNVTYHLTTDGMEVTGATEGEVTVPPESTFKATWRITVSTSGDTAQVLMRAEAGDLTDAVEMTLPVYRYTTPEISGTSGQVALDETRLELVRILGNADPTRGELDITLEPSLAAGMGDSLDYLKHYPYECVEQTMSRFLPNVVSYEALKSLGEQRPDLEHDLEQQVGVGLQRIYSQQHVDGGWGWWQREISQPGLSAYVVFGLAKAKQAGFTVDPIVLTRGVGFVTRQLKAPAGLKPWQLNEQAFMLYALAEAGNPEPSRAGAIYEGREKLSEYAKAYLAMALGLISDEASQDRIQTLLDDLGGRAITSATAAHWEEEWTDYWNMNTDVRTTSIVLDAFARLRPEFSLGPNTVRWLMNARKAGRWDTTQENSWAIMALTDWMRSSGELKGDYSWQVALNGEELGRGTVTPDSVDQATRLRAGIDQLLLDQTNALTLQRSAIGSQSGEGQLYYSTHLKTYLPVEEVKPLTRGVSVSREYRLADCGLPRSTDPDKPTPECPHISEAKVGDVIEVILNIVAPNSLHYVVVEDSLPAGTEALDTSLRTTSITAQGPSLEQNATGARSGWSWWWTPTHTDLRDEKVVLFATDLNPGSYQFKYQIRASLPGSFLTLPPTAYQMYFPEVWGRGAGGVFTVTE